MCKEILLAQMRKLIILLLAFTVMILVNLMGVGKLQLMGAVLVGYLAGAAWFGIILSRLMRSTGMTVEQAKRTMVVGLVLRLLLLAVILGVAIHISFEVFITVVSGFFLVYLLVMGLLIAAAYKQPWDC